MEVNGKFYTLWGQFIDAKDDWIGGQLEDFGDSFDRSVFKELYPMKTEITDITLTPNGEDSAFFTVYGRDFGCGFDVKHGGISGGEEGWITFGSALGHEWRIKQPEKKKE